MACLVAVVGLVWVHVELKRDVDALQANLRRCEYQMYLGRDTGLKDKILCLGLLL